MADLPEPTELADRVWTVRNPADGRVCGVVAGTTGVLLVDTPGSGAAAQALVAAVGKVTSLPVTAIAITGPDGARGLTDVARHVGGDTLAVYAHEDAADALPTGDGPEVRTHSGVAAVDLGDRLVELLHPGPAHSTADTVVHVPDAGTTFVGHLVQPPDAAEGTPDLGPTCFPHSWPASLDVVLGMLAPDAVVVPARGSPVDREYAGQQRNAIAVVSNHVRDMAAHGTPAERAGEVAEWPFPVAALEHAVRRGLEQLPAEGRQLPLA